MQFFAYNVSSFNPNLRPITATRLLPVDRDRTVDRAGA